MGQITKKEIKEEIIAEHKEKYPLPYPLHCLGITFFPESSKIFPNFSRKVVQNLSISQYKKEDFIDIEKYKTKKGATEIYIEGNITPERLRWDSTWMLSRGLQHDGFFSAIIYLLVKPILNFIRWRDIRKDNLTLKEHLSYLNPLSFLKDDINWQHIKKKLKNRGK